MELFTGLRLYKIEKLCSEIAISRLFSRADEDVRCTLAYPLRLAWRVDRDRKVEVPRFLVSIPKKRIRHAVDRVTMRRRVREAYRLNRHLIPRDLPVDLAFIYVADKLLPYAKVEHSVKKLLSSVASHSSVNISSHEVPTDTPD